MNSEVTENNCEVKWLLDSGCTDHLVQSDKYFEKCVVLKKPIDVNLPDGKKLRATKVGKIVISFKNYYSTETVRLKNVYFVEGLQRNLLSVSKITESSTIVAQDSNAKIYNKVTRKTFGGRE